LSNVGGEVIHAGTMLYSPPEIVSKSNLKSNPKIDVWSLGIILYALLTKEYPFSGENDYITFMSILKDDLKFPRSIPLSKGVRHLIHKMLEKDPKMRFTMKDIKMHTWMREKHETLEGDSEGYGSDSSIKTNFNDYYDDSNKNNKFNKSNHNF